MSGAAAAAAVRPAEPGTIAICFVAAALQSVRDRGLNADELLTNVGLSPSLLQVPQARVSAKHYGALWRSIALVLDDEFFGQDSRRMKAGSFAMLCHAVVACKTLGQALDRSLRFYALLLDDIAGSVTRDETEARIVLQERVPGANQTGVRPRTFVAAALWGVVLAGGAAHPHPSHRVQLPGAGAQRGIPADVLRGFALQPAKHGDRIELPSYLDLPVVQNERSIKEFLRTAPESILLKYKNGSSLTARVRRRLRQFAPGEVPDFEGLAHDLHLTPATMRRRLHEEGASYQSIKDQLRRDLAIGYLSHSSRSVMDIAMELGFSERSAFHRAFRKWTGASPGEFRRTVQA